MINRLSFLDQASPYQFVSPTTGTAVNNGRRNHRNAGTVPVIAHNHHTPSIAAGGTWHHRTNTATSM